MPDNLTQQFKKELEKRGIVATDAQITSYLEKQGALKPPQQKQLTPISNSIQERAARWGATPTQDNDKINLLQGE